MQATRRLAGLAIAAVAAVTLPLTVAQPAQAGCASGTYPPSNCAPTLSLTAPASRFTLATARVSWQVKYSGASIAKYQVRYNRAPWNGPYQGWQYPASWQDLNTGTLSQTLPAGYTYCYSARAIDTANRVGPWTGFRCTARPLDDRKLTVSSGWTRRTSSNYYFGTYTGTRVLNARAYRTNAYVARIAVVGTTCAKCGTLDVYVGSTRVGTLGFYSSTTKYKQFRSTPLFSVRRGTITLRNAVSGKLVFLDGLGVSRN